MQVQHCLLPYTILYILWLIPIIIIIITITVTVIIIVFITDIIIIVTIIILSVVQCYKSIILLVLDKQA